MMTRHEKALALAKEHKRTERELLALLMQMQEANEFLKLGYRNCFDYVWRALQLSEAQACYFSQVSRKAKEVPQLKKAIDDGALSLSKARRIVPVVTAENAPEWIKKASTLPQRDLEREVSNENPNATVRERIRPIAVNRSELRVGLSLEMEVALKRVQDLLSQKRGKPASLEEAIKAATEFYLEREDPVLKAAREKNRKSEVPSIGRCALPANVKHAVFRRDEGRCTFRYADGSRCLERRWIQLHHCVPVARGGANTSDNLVTLCRAHHSGQHWGFGLDRGLVAVPTS